MTSLTAALVLVLHASLPKIDQDRLTAVTDDMTAVIEDEISKNLLNSKIKNDEALAMLTAAVLNESGYSADVESCKINGDGGRSIGLGQVMKGQNWEGHSRKQICSDRKLQLRLALHVIDKCWERTPRPDAAFRCYTSGDASKDSKSARREYKTYLKYKNVIEKFRAEKKRVKQLEENNEEIKNENVEGRS